MKGSVIYLSVFILGVLLALFKMLPEAILFVDISKWLLYILLFLVGIQIGTGKKFLSAIRFHGFKIMLIPLATTIGTFAMVSIASIFLPDRTLTDCLSIGAGFAYYSLSSILITEYKGAELGTVALLANIIREFYVLVFAPQMVKYFGKLSPICAGGATTMDTTLPVISRYSGSDYVVIAIFHGMIIDFSVPLWVTFFLNI